VRIDKSTQAYRSPTRSMARLRSTLTGITGLVALGLIVVALALTAAIVAMVSERTRGIVDAFRPSIDSRVVLSGTLNELQAEGKLVVLTADVTADSESSTSRRILLDLIDAGTTSARVRAPARVQYVISLDEITREDFSYDPEIGRLLLVLPSPRLDTAIVEVSTDPDEVEVYREVGWLRLDAFSGRYNEDRARRSLREAAIEAGRSGPWMSEAQESARREVHRLLAPLVEALREDIEFSIVFYDGRTRTVESPGNLPVPRLHEE
jgi:hypothetical protein